MKREAKVKISKQKVRVIHNQIKIERKINELYN